MIELYFNKVYQFLKYDIYLPFSFIFLIFLTFLYLLKINEKKKNKIYFFLLVLVFITFSLWSLFLSWKQYLLWEQHPVSKYLLPPYQNINYFLEYSYFRFWRDFFYRVLGVFLIFLFFRFLNLIFRRDIFYDDEKIIVLFFGLFFFFPYNLLIIFLSFLILLIIIAIKVFKDRKNLNNYFDFRRYWLLLAWFVFLIQPLLLSQYRFLKFKP